MDRRTLAVLRWPELGFLGFVMPTLRQTPFISGRSRIAGEMDRRAFLGWRGEWRTWLSVMARRLVCEKWRVCCAYCVVPLLGRRGPGDFSPASAVVVLRRKEGWELIARERIARSRSGEGAESMLAEKRSSLGSFGRGGRCRLVDGLDEGELCLMLKKVDGVQVNEAVVQPYHRPQPYLGVH